MSNQMARTVGLTSLMALILAVSAGGAGRENSGVGPAAGVPVPALEVNPQVRHLLDELDRLLKAGEDAVDKVVEAAAPVAKTESGAPSA